MQPLAVGITVMVGVSVAVELLIAVKALMLPVPDPGMPILALLLVHVNVPPAGVERKFVARTLSPLQTVELFGTATVGGADTVMFILNEEPAEMLPVAVVGVTVYESI